MEYRKIISVTGLGGLYELVGSKKDGAIVKSLEDKSTKFVAQRVHNFSHLESIEVYTVRDNVNLTDVFLAMKVSNEALPSEKDAAAVKAYFEKVYPDMDFERVYSSDMKKMVKWYAILQANDIEIKLSEEEEEAEESEDGATEIAAEETPLTEEKAPAKAKTTKTKAVKTEEEEPAKAEEKAPKAKAAKKKED